MPFHINIKEEALVKSRRCCCVCHEFAGVFLNVHHIIPEGENGPSALDNAIVLCLRCHGQAGHYNPNHPIGNKYSPDELRKHRDEWWKWCTTNPEAPLHKVPILVSPTSITLQSGKWKATCNFKVQNRTQVIYYDVVVKIGFRGRGLLTKDIKVDLARPRDELHMQLGDITVFADIFQIRAIDESRNSAIFLNIKSLNPEEVLTFLLQNNSSHPLYKDCQPQASLGICGFAEIPAPTFTRPGAVAIASKVPEKIKLESIALLLKKSFQQ